MSNPSMYETVDQTEEKEVLTLETVNAKVESLFEAMNSMYDILRKGMAELYMHLQKEAEQKEKVVAQGFYTINGAITALTSKIDALADNAVANGMDQKAYEDKAIAKAKELSEMQEKAIQKLIAEQEKAQAEARVDAEKLQASKLTEVEG